MIGPSARPSPSPGPAAHPFTTPLSASTSCLLHMATATAGPAKAAKMIAVTTYVTPTVVVRSVTISCAAFAPRAATSPTASPSQNPNQYNGPGSSSAAARSWPDGCVQPRCQMRRPAGDGMLASTVASAVL